MSNQQNNEAMRRREQEQAQNRAANHRNLIHFEKGIDQAILIIKQQQKEDRELEERNRKRGRNTSTVPQSSSNTPSDSNYFDLMVFFGIVAFCIMNAGTDPKLPTSPVTLDIKAGLSGEFVCAAKDERLSLRYVYKKGHLADGSEAYVGADKIRLPKDGHRIDLRDISKEAKSCADAEKKLNQIVALHR